MSGNLFSPAFVPVDQLAKQLGRPIRIALLERRSKVDEDTKSLEVQHEALMRFMSALPPESFVCDPRQVDDGGDCYTQIVSAWRGDGKHALLRRVLTDLAKYDVVLVHRMDRFGRQALAVLAALDAMRHAGVRLYCVQQGIDTADPSQNFNVGLYALLAQQSSDLSSARIRENKALAKSRGGWRGGAITYGFRPATTHGPDGTQIPIRDTNGYRTLAVDLDQAGIIRDVSRKITVDGLSMAAIVRDLNGKQVPTSRGERRIEGGGTEKIAWSVTTLKRILANPMLMGFDVVGTGRDRFQILRVNGQPHRPHPPILDDDTWHRLQPLISRAGDRRRTASEALLAGLVYCTASRRDGQTCGRHMYGPGAITSNSASYACRTSNTLPTWHPEHCTGNAISAAWLEKMVGLIVAEISRSEPWRQALAAAYTQSRRAVEVGTDTATELAESRHMMTELRLELRSAKSAARREQVAADIDDLDARIARLEQLQPAPRTATIGRIDFAAKWQELTRPQQHAFLTDLIERIDIAPAAKPRRAGFDATRVTVHLRFAGALHLTEPVAREPQVCPECGEKFPRPAALGIHRRFRHNVSGQYSRRSVDTTTTYSCPEPDCPITTTVAGALARHVRAKHGPRQALVCPYGCPSVFEADAARTAHMRAEHPEAAESVATPTICDRCGRSFGSEHGLAIHHGRAHPDTL